MSIKDYLLQRKIINLRKKIKRHEEIIHYGKILVKQEKKELKNLLGKQVEGNINKLGISIEFCKECKSLKEIDKKCTACRK